MKLLPLLVFMVLWCAVPTCSLAEGLAEVDELIQKKNYKSAEHILREQLASDSTNQTLRFRLAQVLAWQAKYAASTEQYDKLLSSNPDNSDYLLGKAQVLYWSGQTHQALLYLNKARHLKPDYEMVWQLQFRVLKKMAKTDELENLRSEAQRRFPYASWWLPVAKVQQPEPTSSEVEFGFKYDDLDNNYSDWISEYLQGEHTYASRHKAYARLERTERFDLIDQELLVGLAIPIDASWNMTVEGSASSSRQVRPIWMAYTNIQRLLGSGWNIQLGIRHTKYNETQTDTITLTAERYWSNYRAAYTTFATQISGDTLSGDEYYTHVLSLDYYYSYRSRMGVALADGKELEYDGSPSPPVSDITTITLKGQHWFAAQWAMTYEVHSYEQGDFYTRNGIRMGLRYCY